MLKFLTAAALLAAGTMLAGTIQAQQTPAANPSQPAAATKPKAPAAKTPAKPAAKAATTQVPLTTDKEKFSYAVGMNFGGGLGAKLRQESVDFDVALAVQGFKDALSAGKTRLTEQEAQAILVQVQTEIGKKHQEKLALQGAANKKEGETFLAENKTKPGVVTLPSGLQYKILTAGTGSKPAATDSVVCNYRGTLINGTEFDSSYKRNEPVTFPVNGVIKGWTEALQLMPVGSKWQLFIPSDLAYGERGNRADIGPNATLIFDVELLSIKPPDKTPDAPGATAKPDKK